MSKGKETSAEKMAVELEKYYKQYQENNLLPFHAFCWEVKEKEAEHPGRSLISPKHNTTNYGRYSIHKPISLTAKLK